MQIISKLFQISAKNCYPKGLFILVENLSSLRFFSSKFSKLNTRLSFGSYWGLSPRSLYYKEGCIIIIGYRVSSNISLYCRSKLNN